MINESLSKKCCCEDISLIENYDLAVADKTKTWDCHHRKETDEGLSMSELKAMGLYYNRPACELIFLTHAEHTALHNKGNTNMLGKRHTAETKIKQSEAKKGENNPSARAVYQIDKTTGEIIKKWNCIKDAVITLKKCTGISACCRGKLKSAGGFIWRYVDK